MSDSVPTISGRRPTRRPRVGRHKGLDMDQRPEPFCGAASIESCDCGLMYVNPSSASPGSARAGIMLSAAVILLCAHLSHMHCSQTHASPLGRPQIQAINTTTTLESHKREPLLANTTTTSASASASPAPPQTIVKKSGENLDTSPLNLVVFRDSAPGFGGNTTKSRSPLSANLTSSAHQLKRHSYNLTDFQGSPHGWPRLNLTRAEEQTLKSVAKGNDQTAPLATPKAADPLDTSDSLFRPQHRPPIDRRLEQQLSGADEAPADELAGSSQQQLEPGEEFEPTDDEGANIDGASSNLSEKKVVKELTKILSKGMSGATDQVRVETLENLKRRQRERKALKDNRARVFEEILNTAIQSHPDNVSKQVSGGGGGGGSGKKSPGAGGRGRSRVRGAASNLRHTSSSGSGLPSNPELDPELASDAETVLQHLHGLASAIDGNSPTGSAEGPSGAPLPGEVAESDDSPASSASANSEPSGDAAEPPDESADGRPKKAASERPLVRQFKKIKNQLSQRRKQLDQIKKLFNIELALDPKNGSLIGKPVPLAGGGGGTSGGRKKQHHQLQQQQQLQFAQDSDDSLQPEEPYEGLASGSSRRVKSPHSAGKIDKGRELLAYLRENPEILASVMAELTVDADPSRPAPSSSGRDETESPSPFHHSLAGASANEYDEAPSASSRRKQTRNSRRNHAQQHQSIEPDDIAWARPARARRVSMSSGDRERERERERSSRYKHEFDSPPVSHSTARRARPISVRSSFGGQTGASSFASPIKRRTAESLLLESLRERQLLNLARLDLVLAERAAANKTLAPRDHTTGDSAYERSGRANETSADHMESYRHSSYDPEQPQSQSQQSRYFTEGSGGAQLSTRQPGGLSANRSDSAGDGELTHHFMMVNPSYSGNDTHGRQLNSNEYLSTLNSIHQGPRPPYQPAPYTDRPAFGPAQPAVGGTYAAGNSLASQQQQQQQHPYGLYSSSSQPASSINQSQLRPSQQRPLMGAQSPPTMPSPPPPPPLPPLNAQSSAGLRRFRDWRDVSQSELERSSSPHNASLSWYPYDLSTGGGTLASTMEAQSSKPAQFINFRSQTNSSLQSHAPAPLNLQAAANQPALGSSGSGIGGIQQPGESNTMVQQMSMASQSVNNDVNSQFMTRSSVAEPDATTVKLSSNYEDPAPARERQSQQQQPPSRRNNDLRGAAQTTAPAAATSASDQDEDSGKRAESDDDGDPSPPTGGLDKLGEPNASPNGGGSSHADYFSSYKDEIVTARKRPRALRASHRQQRQQQRDSQSEPDSDDTGAMWA